MTLAAEAVSAGAPQLWDHVPGNVALDAEIGDARATDAAFAKAAHRVRLETRIQRVTGVHLEPRAVIASFDAASDRYTVHVTARARRRTAMPPSLQPSWASSARRCASSPHATLAAISAPATPRIRTLHWSHTAARLIGRPVKYLADRNESFMSDYQGRDLTVAAEIALDAKGTILAMRSDNLSNIGAHAASFVPLNKGVQLMTSLYAVPSCALPGARRADQHAEHDSLSQRRAVPRRCT